MNSRNITLISIGLGVSAIGGAVYLLKRKSYNIVKNHVLKNLKTQIETNLSNNILIFDISKDPDFNNIINVKKSSKYRICILNKSVYVLQKLRSQKYLTDMNWLGFETCTGTPITKDVWIDVILSNNLEEFIENVSSKLI